MPCDGSGGFAAVVVKTRSVQLAARRRGRLERGRWCSDPRPSRPARPEAPIDLAAVDTRRAPQAIYAAEVSFCECGRHQRPHSRELVSLRKWRRKDDVTFTHAAEPDPEPRAKKARV